MVFVLRKCFRKKYTLILYFTAFVVILNELVIFYSYKFFWPDTLCGDLKDYYKVLLVADPQILGENTESWIARWDSDRFLRNTYFSALHYAQPSVVIFLGDLMDEGSNANSEQYSRYLSRFKWIFKHESFRVNMTIFLPGDNDIGGEDEPIYNSALQRFKKTFDMKSSKENYENLEFYKINKLLRGFPKISKLDNSTIRIAVSHIPVLGYADDTSESIIKQLRPHLIFSGHDHKSVHFVGDLNTGETVFMEIFNNNRNDNDHRQRVISKWRFQSSRTHTNEIIIPTCSYRMGVENIGYGLAIIDKKGEYFCYQTLWLPQRLHQLILYLYLALIIFPILLIVLFLQVCNQLLHFKEAFKTFSNDSSDLILYKTKTNQKLLETE